MLSLIAWRNIWRNKVRSFVVIASVILGIWAGTFIMSFSFGMSEQYVHSSIEGQISHLQVHHPDYKKDKEIKFTIPDAENIVEQISKLPEVKAVCSRSLVGGMASSANSGAGIQITGINTTQEDSVTHLSHKIISGDYFSSVKRNPIIVSERLAKKLKVSMGNKIILTFQDVSGNISAGAFRIIGIFRTGNSVFDDANVFVKADDLNNLAGIHGASHEIAVLLKSDDNLVTVQAEIKKIAPSLSVETWKEIAPELRLVIESYDQYMYLFIGVILLALAFGIVNTMLMAVLERVHELGMLMSVGMNKTKVFLLIMLETIYLALIGGPLGLLLAFATISFFGKSGIDLSMFSAGFESYGMSPIVYTHLLPGFYLDILIMIIVAAVVSAIYPSLKAIQIKPAQAIKI